MRAMMWIFIAGRFARAAMSSRFFRLRLKRSRCVSNSSETWWMPFMRSIHSPGNHWASCRRSPIYPNTHYLIAPDRYERAITGIEEELEERVAAFRKKGQLLEAQRHRAAHQVRSGDDSRHGVLPWDRELFAPSQRAELGRAASDAVGLFPQGLSVDRR